MWWCLINEYLLYLACIQHNTLDAFRLCLQSSVYKTHTLDHTGNHFIRVFILYTYHHQILYGNVLCIHVVYPCSYAINAVERTHMLVDTCHKYLQLEILPKLRIIIKLNKPYVPKAMPKPLISAVSSAYSYMHHAQDKSLLAWVIQICTNTKTIGVQCIEYKNKSESIIQQSYNNIIIATITQVSQFLPQ